VAINKDELFGDDHRFITGWGHVEFWKNGRAAAGNELWDRADVLVHRSHTPVYSVSIDYTKQNVNDMEKHHLLSQLWRFEGVFEAGKEAKLKELRTFLGIR
jgi:hypothetical protein